MPRTIREILDAYFALPDAADAHDFLLEISEVVTRDEIASMIPVPRRSVVMINVLPVFPEVHVKIVEERDDASHQD
jgi:hypothetical protein